MKYVFTIVALFISTAALADPCGPNCYMFDINGDKHNDKIEFVIGQQTENLTTHELNLKVSLSKERTVLRAHDHITEYPLVPVYTLVTDSANITKNFVLTVAENSRIAVVQWSHSDGTKLFASYNIMADGTLERIK